MSITDVEGRTHLWGPTARTAGDVPNNLSFSTKRGDGFATFNTSLSRRIDQDYVDLGLLREVVVTGTGGDVAYEGRVNAMPRSMGTTHEIAVSAAGWMSHAKDRKFQEVYVDRDLNRWTQAGTKLQIAHTTAGFAPGAGSVTPDDSGVPSLLERFNGAWDGPTARPLIEAVYDSNGVPISSVYYAWTKGANVNAADANWVWDVLLSTDDVTTVTDSSGSLRAAGPATGTLTATDTNRLFALVRHWYNNAAAGSYGQQGTAYDIYWTCLAVYGQHGLTKRGTASATSSQGFYSSDVIKNIAQRFCPMLNTAGVQDTSFVNQQVAFTDRIYPYDAFLQLNRPHLWNLSVFDNRTLYYRPTDLTDYDWEVRLSDPGVTVSLQGDDTENLANGIAVTYTDVMDSKVRTVTPDDDSNLADTNPANPANIAGYPVWTEITISTPVTRDEAIQFARASLSEFNAPKAPGTIKVTGYIRDRAGHWQPVWKVRCDDRICITDHPNDRNRLIVETDYSHDSHEMSIAVDAPFQRMDAVFDRIQMALQAANLT